MKFCFFTVATRNYAAWAATLMQSVREQHPDSKRFIALVDGAYDDEAPAPAGLDFAAELIPIQDLAIPGFERMAFRYSPMELSVSLKPRLFLHLMTHMPADIYVYFDSDILVLNPLDALAQAVKGGASLVISPHITAPLNPDGKHPDELAIMQSGTYNLGLLAATDRPESRALMEWWADRLTERCVVDIENGLFIDQRWMDMAPSFVGETAFLRAPGYNVAYWNMPHRTIERTADGKWTVDGAPLAFFHFSGIKPDDASIFSVHQDRYSIDDIGPVRELFDTYLGRLHDNGWADNRNLPYAFRCFADGRPIHPLMRRYYRDCAAELPAHTDPFTALSDAFDQPDPNFGPDAPITRLMTALWQAREDLQAQFDITNVQGRLGLHLWLAQNGEAEMGIDQASRDAATALQPAPPGADMVCRVSWRAGQATGEAVSGLARSADAPQTVRMLLPPSQADIEHFRLYPIDRPGAFLLHGLEVTDREGATLWRWDGSREGLSPEGADGATLAEWPGEDSTLCIMHTPNTYLVLPLDPPARAALGAGGMLTAILEPLTRLRLADALQHQADIATDREAMIATLQAQLGEEQKIREALLASFSWRITRPVRALTRLFQPGAARNG